MIPYTLRKKHLQFCFGLALLIHVLLLFCVTFSLNLQIPKKNWDIPIETYIYREEKNNPVTHPEPIHQAEEKNTSSKFGIEKPMPTKTIKNMSSSETISVGKGEQNINLTLKTKNLMNKPLLNILTKAVAAHLFYPKIAVDFRLHGIVTIGFMLSPEGQLSEFEIVQSSGTDVLDEAAMAAMRAASPLKNIQPYLPKTEPFLFTIAFR